MMYGFIEDDESTTYDEVLNNLESDKWLKAMKPEMDSCMPTVTR